MPPRRLASSLAGLLLVALLAGGCSQGTDAPSDSPPTTASTGSTEAPGDTAASAAVDAPPPTRTDAGRTVEERIEAASRAARVKTALVEERSLRAFDFEPRVTGDRVTLSGDVATREQGQTAAEVAAGVDGIDGVLNRLTVGGQRVTWSEGSSGNDGGQQAASSGGEANGGSGTYHTVEAGESLQAIASTYGTSVRRVRELNDMRSGALQSGQRLLVARGDGSNGSGEAQRQRAGGSQRSDDAQQQQQQSEASSQDGEAQAYYVVKSGESLWTIAQKNDVTVDRLKELNGLSSNSLMPGDRLRVE